MAKSVRKKRKKADDCSGCVARQLRAPDGCNDCAQKRAPDIAGRARGRVLLGAAGGGRHPKRGGTQPNATASTAQVHRVRREKPPKRSAERVPAAHPAHPR